ncbi:MAG: PEP-CTERM sorting domain-containing protein [candidate division Zixibacteria bacterium]|nr:PEP-CTERM sorting domain-containing protein [candidate division Zixibacteria bacterium]
MKKVAAFFAIALALTVALYSNASALTASLYDPGNSGISAFSFAEFGADLYFTEEWTASKRGFILIYGLDPNTVYTVHKSILNNTGIDWTFFSNELLDPYGQPEDDTYDPQPYPGWVPAGWSTSNDNDGLSFAQGFAIPKTSIYFRQVQVDEISHARDFIEFYDGTVSGTGVLEWQEFGLTNSGGSANEPFLLAQRPNEHSVVPEPGTLMLLGSGLLGFGIARRRK